MDDTWRGHGLFDHGFLTGQIPESLVDRIYDAREREHERAERAASFTEYLPEPAARLLFAAELELNAALAALEDIDLTSFEIARSKIQVALYVLDIAAENLAATKRISSEKIR